MAWTPPTKPVNWQDTPSTSTALDAANLNADEAYAVTVGTSVVNYFEGGSSPSVVNVGSAAPGSGNTGDYFIVRSDGTVARYRPPLIQAWAWGVKADGATDDSSAWFNALAQAATNKQGVEHPGGVSVVSQAGAVLNGTSSGSYPAAVVIPLGCSGIIGVGIGGDTFMDTDALFVNGLGSWFKLKTGSNCDVIQSANFATLTGQSSPPGHTTPERFVIRDIGIDGNNFSSNNTSGWGIRLYGRGYRCFNYIVQNCASGGVYTEWGSGGYDMIAMHAFFSITNNGGDGLQHRGPHDTQFMSGAVSSNAGIGVNMPRGALLGNEGFLHVHVWGNTGGPQWLVGNSNATFTNCFADGTAGAGTCGVRVLGSGNQWVGGNIYGTNTPGEIGVEFGDGSTVVTCQGNRFDTHFYNYAKGSVLVRYRTNATVNRNRFSDPCARMGGNIRYAAGEGYGTLSGSHTFPQGTITLTTSTAAWATSGSVYIGDGSNTTVVNYTGISGSTLTGCTGGTGTFAGGSVAFQVAASTVGDAWEIVDPDNLNAFGLVQEAQAGYTRSFNDGIVLNQGDFDVATAGKGLKVKEGSNCKQGTATLAAGTVTVANTSVTASSRILLTSNTDGGTPGWLRVSARSAGTSFTITSSSGTDTSTVAFQIFEPG